MQRNPAAGHERRAHEKGPQPKIGKEDPGEPASTVADRALDQRLASGELPAGEAFVDHEFEKSTERRSPQDRGAELAARECSRGKIARAHAGGSDQQAGPDQREQAAAGLLSRRGSTQRWKPRALS